MKNLILLWTLSQEIRWLTNGAQYLFVGPMSMFEKESTSYSYKKMVENIRGHFLCQQLSSIFQQDFVDLFGIYDVEKSHKIIRGFHGDVAFFELYIQKNAKEATYPDNFSELVVQSQSINV